METRKYAISPLFFNQMSGNLVHLFGCGVSLIISNSSLIGLKLTCYKHFSVAMVTQHPKQQTPLISFHFTWKTLYTKFSVDS